MATKYKFVDVRKGVSKSGNDYSFVKLSDGLASFSVSNPRNIDCSSFKKGQDVTVEFDIQAGYKGDPVVTITKML